MGGYRGDGYGIHGQYGDDDYNEETREAREGMREDRRERYEDRFGRNERGHGRYQDDGRFMFGRNEDRGERHWRDHDRGDEGRGFFERARSEASSWFSDDDDDRSGRDRDSWRAADRYRQRYGMQGHEGQYGRQHGEAGSWGRQDRSGGFSGGSQDQHYRSWRDRQMQELDRDYQDYCREREQQFHQDFDSWRRNRRQQNQDGQGMSQSGSGEGHVMAAESETLILTDPTGESGGPDQQDRKATRSDS